jgi:hypothetical protein
VDVHAMKTFTRVKVEINYTRMSTFEHLLNSIALDGWDIYNGWIIQETLRIYTKPPYTKNDLIGHPRIDGKMM